MLPRPPTSFIGRESELAQARGLLAGTRLLTLTGSGGCGQTRLAIELARRTCEDFPHGVHFVTLAAVRDPALVPVSIARGIGLQDARGTPLLGTPQRLPCRAGRTADPGQHRRGARCWETLRLLESLGAAAAAVIAMAVVRDRFTGHAAATVLSRFILVVGASPVLAPTVGR